MDFGSPLTGPPELPVTHYPADYDPSFNGIGGCLVLVIIGRFLTIIAGIKDIADLSEVVGRVPALDDVIRFTVVIDIFVYIILSAVILYFLFTRKIVFRLLFVIQVGVVLLFAILLRIYLSSQGYDTSGSSLVSTIVNGLIWIPYMYVSKRVKNTYIYPYQNFEVSSLDSLTD